MLARDDIREPVIDALAELGGAEVIRPLVDILNTSGSALPVTRALARLHERYEARYGGGAYVTTEFQAALAARRRAAAARRGRRAAPADRLRRSSRCSAGCADRRSNRR